MLILISMAPPSEPAAVPNIPAEIGAASDYGPSGPAAMPVAAILLVTIGLVSVGFRSSLAESTIHCVGLSIRIADPAQPIDELEVQELFPG